MLWMVVSIIAPPRTLLYTSHSKAKEQQVELPTQGKASTPSPHYFTTGQAQGFE